MRLQWKLRKERYGKAFGGAGARPFSRDLGDNAIGDDGVGKLGEVLVQCSSPAHPYLRANRIGVEGAGRLAAVLPDCASLAHLYLRGSRIGAEGAGRLAEVLPQCASLAHLDLYLTPGMMGQGGSRW